MLSVTPGDGLCPLPWAYSLRLGTRGCQPWKQLLLLLALEAQKPRKTAPKTSTKRPKSCRKSIKHDFCEKSTFAIPSMRKPRIWSPKHQNFDSEIDKKVTWKQTRRKIEISSLGIQKAIKIRSKNRSKIDGNLVPDHLMSILLLPWSSRVVPRCQNGPPGCSQGAKLVSQGVKMEAPMAATAHKLTASSPCNHLPATC